MDMKVISIRQTGLLSRFLLGPELCELLSSHPNLRSKSIARRVMFIRSNMTRALLCISCRSLQHCVFSTLFTFHIANQSSYVNINS